MIKGERTTQIVCDVGNEVPIEKSRVPYTPEEIEFRQGLEKRFKEAQAKDGKILLAVSE
jgi:hypothetical protein